jgi:hypothetical protein
MGITSRMATDRNEGNLPPVNPEQAARQVRFALSELSSENAHHEKQCGDRIPIATDERS